MGKTATIAVPEEGRGADSLPRVLALDAARAIAVLGMFAVHMGPSTELSDQASWLSVFEGRASALFAVLAGVSVALLSGGDRPTRDRTRLGALRIAVRAVLVVLVGLALAQLESSIGVLIILVYYGLFFLCALPLLRLRGRTLALIAVVWAVAGPVVSFLIRSPMETTYLGNPTFDMFTSLTGVRALAESLLLTGIYPVMTWMPFIIAGMALGRIGIRSVRPAAVIGLGAVLAVLGHGGSWVAQQVLGGRDRLVEVMLPEAAELGLSDSYLDLVLDGSSFGTVGTNSWWWLTIDTPHSGTPFDIFAVTGSALLVIGVLLLVTPRAHMALRPLISAGSCALSLYILHLVALWVLAPLPDYSAIIDYASLEELPPPPSGIHEPGWSMLGLVAIGGVVLATLWRSVFRRGPAEWLLHGVSLGIAKRVVPVAERRRRRELAQ
ncbi:heparan-alpha-glucosaminide N-acetyltransferase domain-containing protein [Nocardia huaxiensis]|uniref:DUF1624 domain-containing protein n=1 Tax=Nocardia huaxiensis TaxID=2755382 RepID=A0A7D6ZE18_9NOCA|nr:heparan-alpha-glucosaminide N-acetyltransferase domain-containing protein [Nocardia huaxiensis]QLY31438.1 DUF1624 domain-containing protein [Nocardia huaxiensis]UFS94987.1 heparan-alpha-glucosaminide N-acetyltransferase domain-containing protein [Nocardia huaxiensis]